MSYTKKEYDRLKDGVEQLGHKVLTRYRKGLKTIRLSDIVLRETSDKQEKEK